MLSKMAAQWCPFYRLCLVLATTERPGRNSCNRMEAKQIWLPYSLIATGSVTGLLHSSFFDPGLEANCSGMKLVHCCYSKSGDTVCCVCSVEGAYVVLDLCICVPSIFCTLNPS